VAGEARKASRFVRQKIESFANSRESALRASLAVLRRGIGRSPGSMPELWQATFQGLPEDLLGMGREPTRVEWAVHTALTLYALHQQGKSLQENCMHKDGQRLGMSIRALIHGDDEEARIKRRFDAVATSGDLNELTNHLRGLVQLLRGAGVALDYAHLTEDLYYFQFPEARDSVRLGWGRDFYRVHLASDAE
jgi:CRISPR system Cascade subunit CasB